MAKQRTFGAEVADTLPFEKVVVLETEPPLFCLRKDATPAEIKASDDLLAQANAALQANRGMAAPAQAIGNKIFDAEIKAATKEGKN